MLCLEAGLGLCFIFLLSSLYGLGFFVAGVSWQKEGSSGSGVDRGFVSVFEADRRSDAKEGASAVILALNETGTADVFKEPSEQSRRVGQALLGDPVEALEERSGWRRVRFQEYPLTGWVRDAAVVQAPPPPLIAGARLRFMIAEAPGVQTKEGPYLPFGAKLPLAKPPGKFTDLLLPNGKTVQVAGDRLAPAEKPLDLETGLLKIQQFRGRFFQEGGNSREGLDAPGLVFLAYRSLGVDVPRDLEELLRAGRTVSQEEAGPGDVAVLVPFNPDQPLQPVLLLNSNGHFIEASPSTGVGLAELDLLGNRKIREFRRYLKDSP